MFVVGCVCDVRCWLWSVLFVVDVGLFCSLLSGSVLFVVDSVCSARCLLCLLCSLLVGYVLFALDWYVMCCY